MTSRESNVEVPILKRREIPQITSSQRMTRAVTKVISFTSGKGGVGKTNTVVNLGIALGQLGNQVLVLDADLGLANVDILLGLSPQYTLSQVLSGTKSIDDIIVDAPQGLSVIPAASGIEQICDLSIEDRMTLFSAIESITQEFDYLLIDTRAGISSDVMYFNSAASEIVVVVTPEPTSLTDAYALMKVLHQNYGETEFSIITNEVKDEKEAEQIFRKLENAVSRFLHVSIQHRGSIPIDPMINEAIRNQKALLEQYPSSPSGSAFRKIARTFEDSFEPVRLKGGMQFFFRKILDLDHLSAF